MVELGEGSHEIAGALLVEQVIQILTLRVLQGHRDNIVCAGHTEPQPWDSPAGGRMCLCRAVFSGSQPIESTPLQHTTIMNQSRHNHGSKCSPQPLSGVATRLRARIWKSDSTPRLLPRACYGFMALDAKSDDMGNNKQEQ